MPTSAPVSRRTRRFSGFIMLALCTVLAAGCSSSRVAYRFQPPAGVPVAPGTDTARPDSGTQVAAVAPIPAAVVQTRPLRESGFGRVRPAGRQLRQQLRRAVAQAVARPAVSFRSKSAMQQVRRVAGPQQPAEVGLGTTVLGVLGLVVLPISLIGLLIWGGPVWAVLAGLAALAVLIAYLDPFA